MYHLIAITISAAAVALIVAPIVAKMVETFATVNAALAL